MGALRLYGLDELLIAVGVTFLTSLLKKTVLKNAPSKVYVFLPFGIGIVLFAAYRMLATLSVTPLSDPLTIEGGFGCGCVATLYYVVYEQFIRKGKNSLSPLCPLLKGVVSEEKLDEAAETLLSGSKGISDEERSAFVAETLARYALPELSEIELTACFRLVERYLASLGDA